MDRVRRCKYCPSDELRPSSLHLLDILLGSILVRRYRCEFCGVRQWVWLAPRPLRWSLAALALGMGWLLSLGPVEWLHHNHRISNATYHRLEPLYSPFIWYLGSEQSATCPVARAFGRYRNWWTLGEVDLSDVKTQEQSAPFLTERQAAAPVRGSGRAGL
jgi:hypothetical protein